MNGDELDTILDDALASYTRQGPRAGLNARIIARVRAEGDAPRWNWLRFAAAALALAGLTAALVMWRSEAPAPAPVRVQTAEPRVPNGPVVRVAERPRAVQRDTQRESLTPEQRALLTFALQAPEAARQLTQPDKPLEIEAINIQPIQIDALEIGEIK